jgi:hypothetical protein
VSLALTLWRAFPWDRAAAPGDPFSPLHIQSGQTSGRFDLHDRPPVLYLGESAEHALGELLQGFRSRTIGAAHLKRRGRPLAVVAVRVPPAVADQVVDCTDPAALALHHLRPDQLASHDRSVTQAIARRLHESGVPGFRWWSALTGEWHGVVLFDDRVPASKLDVGTPEEVTVAHPALARCAALLGIALGGLRLK